MSQYQYQQRDGDVEKGAATMSRADERMQAYKKHGGDQLNSLKKRPSFSDHSHRLVRKTSSRLGFGRKNSIGFHNDGTLWEHIVTCKMDAFDCCVMGVCYATIGLLVLGLFLAFAVPDSSKFLTPGFLPSLFPYMYSCSI